MHFNLLSLVSVLTAVKLTLAYPLSANETLNLNYFDKRDTLICGFAARLVDFTACLPAGINFKLSADGKTVTREALTKNAAGHFLPPANSASECDHIIELALLNTMFNKNGYCAVANVLGRDFTADDKTNFLQTPINLINAQAANTNSIAHGTPVNLVFVTKSVNQQKQRFVTEALATGKAPANALNEAIVDYLKETRTQSLRVAAAIDSACAAKINTLKTGLLRNAGKATGRAKTADERLEQAVAAHEKLIEGSHGLTVVNQWKKVLATPAK
ncbi:hypothetical protein SISNIDRAFT_461293 [Sistotremastrum niveocremeum HHB9708]|uniref:Uncharacterized protein n=1 Tax=Sistotremastrum niveocremeum HHB9708 TaxID=1314777 RepID=A0A164MSD9_9AGAM|nr:hypothetical protein SISNIDRAFT_461293 [Sistotremastrum niveocremeum HHB9708]